MKRDEFLKSFGLASTGLFLPTNLLKDKPIKVYDNYVRGLTHYSFKRIKNKIKEGDSLLLKTETTNSYDPFAIEVFWGEYKLGYIAAYENIALSNILEKGGELIAFVSSNVYMYGLDKALAIEIYVNLIVENSQAIIDNRNIRADDQDGKYR